MNILFAPQPPVAGILIRKGLSEEGPRTLSLSRLVYPGQVICRDSPPGRMEDGSRWKRKQMSVLSGLPPQAIKQNPKLPSVGLAIGSLPCVDPFTLLLSFLSPAKGTGREEGWKNSVRNGLLVAWMFKQYSSQTSFGPEASVARVSETPLQAILGQVIYPFVSNPLYLWGS